MSNAQENWSRAVAIAVTLALHLAVLGCFYLGTRVVSITGADDAVTVTLLKEPNKSDRKPPSPAHPLPTRLTTLMPPPPIVVVANEDEGKSKSDTTGSISIADPNYLSNPAPIYPPASLRNGEQGTVLLRVHVSADGRALSVEIEKSSGFARLDASALETVRSWTFVPAKKGGEPVDSWVDVPVIFSLKG